MSLRKVWAVGACLALLAGCGGETDLLTSPVGTVSDAGAGGDTGSGPGSGCDGLAACCHTLPAAAQSGCAMFLTADNATECEEALTEVQQVGYCGGPQTGSGSGSSPPVNATCETLAECCAGLPAADAAQCAAVIASGNATSCATFYGEVTAAGFCDTSVGSGTGSGQGQDCQLLSGCCHVVPAEDIASCDAIVASGVEQTCSEALTAYADANTCSISFDGGTIPDTSCDQLATCCSSSELSPEQVTACEEASSSGDQPACAQEIATYCVN